jgi:2-C-methyl-D-erythritol 4-phosphate cytidylyltransferase
MNVAIVVAGGKGTRFGGNRPKQFLELIGLPIIIHTLRQFEQSCQIEQVVVVLAAAEIAQVHSLIEKSGLQKVARIVAGGATRAQSVRNGLAAIETADIVAVHDGVRPLVKPEEIDATVALAAARGAAILVAPVGDTIKRVDDGRISVTLPRRTLRRALTPQCFQFEILKRAYANLDELEASGADVTDDSLLVEHSGVTVAVVEGSARNIKITTEEDLALAEALLSAESAALNSYGR